MKQLTFVYFSGILGFSSPLIREVRKEIAQRVDKDKVSSAKHDIEIQLIGMKDGLPKVLYSCYLYNDSFEMMHGSIVNTKRYLKESWIYHMNKMHSYENNTGS